MNFEDKFNRALEKAIKERIINVMWNNDDIKMISIEIPQFCHDENTHIINVNIIKNEFSTRYDIYEYKSKSRSKHFRGHMYTKTFFADYQYDDLSRSFLFNKVKNILKEELEKLEELENA